MSVRPDVVYDLIANSTALGDVVPAVSAADTSSAIQSRPDSSTAANYNDPILMAHTITLIPGDGIGPEVTNAVVRILAASGVPIDWDTQEAGIVAVERHRQPLPEALIGSIRRNKVALKGPVTTPIGEGFTSVNVGLRKSLDLYANLRPVWNLPGVPAKFSGVDLVIVRENTEDLYAGLEHQIIPGVVESLKIITERASTRIGRFAFEHATRHGRKRVTAIHKANIMKLSDGLFLESVRAVASEFPGIAYDEKIIDAACMHLVMNPGQFDVLVLPNLYGDIVSDLCAGLVGGLGVVGAANLGAEIGVFEAVHGSAPDIAGQNIANPTALLLSAVLMLRHIGEVTAASRIMAALGRVLADGSVRTRDLGGRATTYEFSEAICRVI
jgi:isocitrate dehydrogenase (NAD+)